MSVYSTICLTETQAIKKIAEHMNIDLEYGGKELTKLQLIDLILFNLTSNNIYSPNYWNNYFILPDE